MVSIIIPAYNSLKWIPETILSIDRNSYPEVEVIVVDDGSTDGTSDWLCSRYPEIQIIRTKNHGVSHARNVGLRAARGEFVQYLDSDDLLLPGKIDRHLKMMSDSPGADVIYSDWQRLNTSDGIIFHLGEMVSRRYEDVNTDPEIAFFTDMWCPTGCYFYRRSFLNKIPPWRENLPVIQDARYALDCAMAGANWLYDPTVSVSYRQHLVGSISTRSRRAFIKDCATNADEVRRLWLEKNELSVERRVAALGVMEGLAKNAYDLDRDLFCSIHASILELDPNFVPSEWGRAILTKVLNFEASERIASNWRRFRSAFRKR